MEKDQPQKPEDYDLLNNALDEFNDDPLNLTNEEKNNEEEDPEMVAKMQEEYQKFISEMKNPQFGGDESMEGLTEALGGLLKGLSESLGGEGGKEGEDFKNLLNSNLPEGNMEDFAGKLLQMFMKKDLLYEPLLQSKANYDQFFKKEEGKIPAEDLTRFQAQYNVIKQIIIILDKDPENKQKLMELFQKMQDYGQPPTGITSVSIPGSF